MVGTEWAAFEIVALAAGVLEALPLVAQSTIMTTDQILNTIPFGIGATATTRVGHLIGSRSAAGAKRRPTHQPCSACGVPNRRWISEFMRWCAACQGRQQLGAAFNFAAYYVIALPVGITLAFHPRTQLGLQGLWIAKSWVYLSLG
ncbi:putative matE [Lyophyllum shimeji]|uniref:MatE n=1 Tax=Lyophyllum shimeji TaxID=47721 RepID=A0A9P3PJV6_LYOSH|nr:putative matE [Lyophyllum shimeji]